ncbi:hypothetical protein AB0K52_06390 [Glycomyces sp. NPDC049804]|uniref:hypothetical protein n=1 Tax=Glycomyces sp. NPDC049804 TaxID=3154363 RepID=UPI00341E2117
MLELGDEVYIAIADFDPFMESSMTLEEPASDYTNRFGNVVLQGCYNDDTADSRPGATAAAETSAAETQTLLAEG